MSLKTIPCPNCGRAADASSENEWRPFCCRRCKLIDLGDWLSEAHRIPDESGGDGDGEPWSAPGGEDTEGTH